MRRRRAVQVLGEPGLLGEPGVVVGHEGGEERVRRLDGADPGEPQLLHEPVLQGLVRPLDPALRLRAVGADDGDGQLVQRPPELGHAVAAGRVRVVDAEDAVPVRVEGDRLAVRLDVGCGSPPCRRTRSRLARTGGASAGWSRRRRTPAGCRAGRGPRTRRCWQPSICTSSPRRSRRWRGWWTRPRRALRGTHRPASLIHCRSVSRDSRRSWASASFSAASVGPKSA